jgi:hypothetical protein
MPLLGRLARGPANPLVVNAAVAAPAQDAAVGSLAAVPAGKYIAHIITRLTGTVDEVPTKRANLELRSSASPAATLASGIQTELTGTGPGFYRTCPFELTGASTISLNAKAGATASTAYNATLILERIA